MSHSPVGAKATSSIWLLTVIGLMAGCLLLGVEEYLGRYVENSHEDLAQDQERTTLAIESLSGAVESAGDLLQGILDQSSDGSEGSLDESVATLMLGVEAAMEELDRTDTAPAFVVQQLLAIDPKVRAWRQYRSVAEARIQGTLDDVRNRLKGLQAQAQSAAGKQRLMRAVDLSKYRRLSGEAATQAAEAIMAKLDQGTESSGMQFELAQLSLLVHKLITEQDPDLLADLKDNRISPSLARLRSLEAKVFSGRDDKGAGQRAVADLERALFGEGFLHDKAHQTIVLGAGGLFTNTYNMLALDGDQARLQATLSELHESFAEERMRMVGKSRDRASALLTEIHDATVAARLRTLPAVLFTALAFVLLARSVARALREQVRDLSASNRKAVKTLLDLELTQRSIPSILIGMDSKQRINTWNVHAETILDTPESVVIGRTVNRIALEWDVAQLSAALDECASSHEVVTIEEMAFTTAGGRRGSLELRISPKIGDDKALHGMLIVGKDVQEHLDMEAQLSQARKLESIGQLAAGIAHEINTPTQYATDNVQFLGDASTDLLEVAKQISEMLGETTGEEAHWTAADVASLRAKLDNADLEFLLEEVPKSIEQCLEGLGTVASIVRAMKEFSHPGVTEKSPVELNRSIESTVAVARNEWKYLAKVEFELDDGLPLVPCVQGEMNQVFLNLLVNAAHAIEDSKVEGDSAMGTITISTSHSDGWAEVRIADTGCGIPDDVCERIFDPFFTTKDIGRGTGQGLAIARSVVVDKHAGTISVESIVGKGTTFIIRLPMEVSTSAA